MAQEAPAGRGGAPIRYTVRPSPSRFASGINDAAPP